MIPGHVRAAAGPEPTPEQCAAIKLEAGVSSEVKQFKRTQKAGKLSAMEKEASDDFGEEK